MNALRDATAATSVTPTAARGKPLFIVDSDAKVSGTEAKTLKCDGHRVETAENGEAAWQVLQGGDDDCLGVSRPMAPRILQGLRARSSAIRMQWIALLRLERVIGPLANPDILMHLIPASLESIFTTLAKSSRTPISLKASKARVPVCDCARNPYSAYFLAGEQALVEAIVLLQAELPLSERCKTDVGDTMLALRQLARSEINTFCRVCQHRTLEPHCRHAVPVA